MLSPFSETLGRPVKSSVLVKRLPHWDWSRLTTSRSSPWASRCAPWAPTKCTCESPLYQPRAFMSVHRLMRSVKSRCPGSMFTAARSGSYSKPRATSTITSPRGSHPWHVPSM